MRLVIVFFLFLGVPSALAANGPVLTRVEDQGKASLWVDRPAGDPISVKLSESLTIVMRVEGEAPLEVEFSEKVRSTEGWRLEMVGKATTMPLDKGQRLRWEQRFLATPLKPGLHPLKLPALQITDKETQEQQVSWKPLPLQITTRVLKVDASEARDRASIEELPPRPPAAEQPWWPWPLVGLPFAALLVFVAWRWHSRPAAELAPADLAIRELNQLGQRAVATPEEVKQYFTRLSDLLRRYLERRFSLPATQRTTAEFFAALPKASPLDGPGQKMLAEILKWCDLAKFAQVMPTGEECQRVVMTAREFVQRTRQTSRGEGSEVREQRH